MGTKSKGRKPLNFYMCESVYSAIAVNLKKHKSTRQAILWFIAESETFTALAEGKLHNEFMASMERNTPDKLLDYQDITMHDPKRIKQDMEDLEVDYIEAETGEYFTKKRSENGTKFCRRVHVSRSSMAGWVELVPPPVVIRTTLELPGCVSYCFLRCLEVPKSCLGVIEM